jgi:hypothetical protein
MTTPTPRRVFAPGIYTDIPEDVYHASEGVSNSLLSKMHRSPAHALVAMTEPDSGDTKARVFGRLYHQAALEPAKLKSWAIKPADMSFATKEGKAWREANAGREIVPHEDYEAIQRMVDKLHSHKQASLLLRLKSRKEVSVYAKDDETGLTLRSRFDLMPEEPVLFDLKSIQDARPHSWMRDCAKFRYHVQAAFYVDMKSRVGLASQDFVFIAQEKDAPFNVMTYQVSGLTMTKGRSEYRRLLNQFAECKKTGEWPGYSDKMEPFDIPLWALADEPYESPVAYDLQAA